MKRKVFSIDIDGVACEHAQGICEAINKDFGISSKEEDIVTWDYNFGPISFLKAVEKYYHSEEFLLGLNVAYGFNNFLNKILELMDVKFVTARKQYACHPTRLWIEKNFVGKYEVIFTKAEKTEIDFDFLIDDSVEEIIASAKVGRISFLFKRPWNDNQEVFNKLKIYSNAKIISDFNEVYALIK